MARRDKDGVWAFIYKGTQQINIASDPNKTPAKDSLAYDSNYKAVSYKDTSSEHTAKPESDEQDFEYEFDPESYSLGRLLENVLKVWDDGETADSDIAKLLMKYLPSYTKTKK